MAFLAQSVARHLEQAGLLRALAVASEKRLPVLPDVPTFKEAGLDGMIASAWYGVMVPAKTPPDVVAKLNQAINKVLKMPEVRQRLTDMGAEIGGGPRRSLACSHKPS